MIIVPPYLPHSSMCNSKINDRLALRPASNHVTTFEKSVLKRGNDSNGLNWSGEKPRASKLTAKPPIASRKKLKKNASLTVAPAGSMAVAHRVHASLMQQQQQKTPIAHYGRTATKLQGRAVPAESGAHGDSNHEEKRCSFITASSDPLYVAYHDEEWGVPVHDDKTLFELLVLCGFLDGMDWTTILKKRKEYNKAFAGFEVEEVSKFTERRISSIGSEHGIEQGRARGVVDNAKRILEVTKVLGSLNKYLWSFINHKPLIPNYKSCRKIPAKTSKSESISRDLVRRGFRFVGPTIIHSFMQAAGLTNDHLLSCPRHHYLLHLSSTRH